MNSIIRRFDRAPLEDRLLRANPAQPPKAGSKIPAKNAPPAGAPAEYNRRPPTASPVNAANGQARKPANGRPVRNSQGGRQSAFAEELAKAL